MKKEPFVTLDKLKEITAQYPTPFHLYDEKGIRENAKALKEAFAWNKGYQRIFCCKGNSEPVSDPDPSGVWLWMRLLFHDRADAFQGDRLQKR